MTAAWGAVVALSSVADYTSLKLIQSAEAARNGAWMFLLHAIYGVRLSGTNHILAYQRWLPWYAAGVVLVLIHLYALPWMLNLVGAPASLERDLNNVMWLGFSVAILVMTEQIYRLSNQSERTIVKHLCLALVFISGYDFLMYIESLILRQLDPVMWQARGAVVAFTAPLIAVTVVRSRKHTGEVQVSPNVVFHTFMLVSAGIYLVYIAGVGYVINYLGGTWSGVVQITFLSASGLTLILLLSSPRIRSMVRVWLSKHFFSYRFDYRREWLDFTDILAQSAGEAPRAVTLAMAKLCGSPGGVLWMRTETGRYSLVDYWQVKSPDAYCDLGAVAEWFESRVWIIDIQEWQKTPALYGDLEIPQELIKFPGAWLIIPLMFNDKAQGILMLCRPEENIPDLNWEARDLLKIAGRAAATHLALYQADSALVELKQFEGFNRLSAYVVHDLKNILAQQSLIVYNAPLCRDEPEFLDDVIETVDNSVSRMKRLMAQMRTGERGADLENVEVGEILQEIVEDNVDKPDLYLEPTDQRFYVEADSDQLTAVFGHLIKNAQEATGGKGRVVISFCGVGESQVQINIEDNGIGMDEEFIKNRLFKPFDTTKGLAGMGIGAYESREYVRQLGGEIFVSSTPGVGSRFSVVLRCTSQSIITTHTEVVESGK